MSLLEQDTTKKGRVDNDVTELDAGDNESGEYKVEAIRNSAVLYRGQRVIYQGSIIWFFGKVIQKKKIPGSLHRPFNTLESSSARSIRIILTSRQRPLRPSTLHHRWPGQPSSQQPSQRLDQRLRNKSEVDHQARALTNELKKTELRLIFIVFLAFLRCG